MPPYDELVDDDSINRFPVEYKVRVSYPPGALVKESVELDNSRIILLVPRGSCVIAYERRLSSDGIVRYRTEHGWISESQRDLREPVVEVIDMKCVDGSQPILPPEADRKVLRVQTLRESCYFAMCRTHIALKQVATQLSQSTINDTRTSRFSSGPQMSKLASVIAGSLSKSAFKFFENPGMCNIWLGSIPSIDTPKITSDSYDDMSESKSNSVDNESNSSSKRSGKRLSKNSNQLTKTKNSKKGNNNTKKNAHNKRSAKSTSSVPIVEENSDLLNIDINVSTLMLYFSSIMKFMILPIIDDKKGQVNTYMLRYLFESGVIMEILKTLYFIIKKTYDEISVIQVNNAGLISGDKSNIIISTPLRCGYYSIFSVLKVIQKIVNSKLLLNSQSNRYSSSLSYTEEMQADTAIKQIIILSGKSINHIFQSKYVTKFPIEIQNIWLHVVGDVFDSVQLLRSPASKEDESKEQSNEMVTKKIFMGGNDSGNMESQNTLYQSINDSVRRYLDIDIHQGENQAEESDSDSSNNSDFGEVFSPDEESHAVSDVTSFTTSLAAPSSNTSSTVSDDNPPQQEILDPTCVPAGDIGNEEDEEMDEDLLAALRLSCELNNSVQQGGDSSVQSIDNSSMLPVPRNRGGESGLGAASLSEIQASAVPPISLLPASMVSPNDAWGLLLQRAIGGASGSATNTALKSAKNSTDSKESGLSQELLKLRNSFELDADKISLSVIASVEPVALDMIRGVSESLALYCQPTDLSASLKHIELDIIKFLMRISAVAPANAMNPLKFARVALLNLSYVEYGSCEIFGLLQYLLSFFRSNYFNDMIQGKKDDQLRNDAFGFIRQTFLSLNRLLFLMMQNECSDSSNTFWPEWLVYLLLIYHDILHIVINNQISFNEYLNLSTEKLPSMLTTYLYNEDQKGEDNIMIEMSDKNSFRNSVVTGSFDMFNEFYSYIIQIINVSKQMPLSYITCHSLLLCLTKLFYHDNFVQAFIDENHLMDVLTMRTTLPENNKNSNKNSLDSSNNTQILLSVIVRFCVETPKILRSHMIHEIEHYYVRNNIKEMPLKEYLKEFSHLIERNSECFKSATMTHIKLIDKSKEKSSPDSVYVSLLSRDSISIDDNMFLKQTNREQVVINTLINYTLSESEKSLASIHNNINETDTKYPTMFQLSHIYNSLADCILSFKEISQILSKYKLNDDLVIEKEKSNTSNYVDYIISYVVNHTSNNKSTKDEVHGVSRVIAALSTTRGNPRRDVLDAIIKSLHTIRSNILTDGSGSPDVDTTLFHKISTLSKIIILVVTAFKNINKHLPAASVNKQHVSLDIMNYFCNHGVQDLLYEILCILSPSLEGSDKCISSLMLVLEIFCRPSLLRHLIKMRNDSTIDVSQSSLKESNISIQNSELVSDSNEATGDIVTNVSNMSPGIANDDENVRVDDTGDSYLNFTSLQIENLQNSNDMENYAAQNSNIIAGNDDDEEEDDEEDEDEDDDNEDEEQDEEDDGDDEDGDEDDNNIDNVNNHQSRRNALVEISDDDEEEDDDDEDEDEYNEMNLVPDDFDGLNHESFGAGTSGIFGEIRNSLSNLREHRNRRVPGSEMDRNSILVDLAEGLGGIGIGNYATPPDQIRRDIGGLTLPRSRHVDDVWGDNDDDDLNPADGGPDQDFLNFVRDRNLLNFVRRNVGVGDVIHVDDHFLAPLYQQSNRAPNRRQENSVESENEDLLPEGVERALLVNWNLVHPLIGMEPVGATSTGQGSSPVPNSRLGYANEARRRYELNTASSLFNIGFDNPSRAPPATSIIENNELIGNIASFFVENATPFVAPDNTSLNNGGSFVNIVQAADEGRVVESANSQLNDNTAADDQSEVQIQNFGESHTAVLQEDENSDLTAGGLRLNEVGIDETSASISDNVNATDMEGTISQRPNVAEISDNNSTADLTNIQNLEDEIPQPTGQASLPSDANVAELLANQLSQLMTGLSNPESAATDTNSFSNALDFSNIIPQNESNNESDSNVTGLVCPAGYDEEVFNSLPDFMQREIIEQHQDVSAQTRQLFEEAGYDMETIAALPENIRQEILEQARQEQLSRANGIAAASQPAEIDNNAFLTSLSPELRAEVLMTSEPAFIASLSPELIAEAQQLREHAAARWQRLELSGAAEDMEARSLADPGRGMLGFGRQPRVVDSNDIVEAEQQLSIPKNKNPGKMILSESDVAELRIPVDILAVLIRIIYMEQLPISSRLLYRILDNLMRHPQMRDGLLHIFSILLTEKPVDNDSLFNLVNSNKLFHNNFFPPSLIIRKVHNNSSPYILPNDLSSHQIHLPQLVGNRILQVLEHLCQSYSTLVYDMIRARTSEEIDDGSDSESDHEESLSNQKSGKCYLEILIQLLQFPNFTNSSQKLLNLVKLISLICEPLEGLKNNGSVSTDSNEEKEDTSLVDIPIVTISKSALRGLCDALLHDLCTKEVFDHIISIIGKISYIESNRNILLEVMREVSIELGSQSQMRLSTFMGEIDKQKYSSNFISDAKILSIPMNEIGFQYHMRLYRALQTLQSLCNSSGNMLSAIAPVDEMLLLWHSADQVLRALGKFIQIEDQSSAGNSSIALSKKKTHHDSAVSAILTKLLPLLESFFLVYTYDILNQPDRKPTVEEEAKKSISESDESTEAKGELPAIGIPLTRQQSVPGAKYRQSEAFSRLNVLLSDVSSLSMEEGNSRLLSLPRSSRSLRVTSSSAGAFNNFMTRPQQLITFVQAHSNIINLLVKTFPALLETSLSALIRIPHLRSNLIFDVKRTYFYSELKKRRAPRSSHTRTIHIQVRRDNIFEDSFHQLRSRTASEMKGRLYVNFHGEEGVDAGGLTREWYSVLSREIFNPNYCLFVAGADGVTFQPNPLSNINSNHLDYFKFVGRLFGKALVDGQLMDGHFTRYIVL
jgi:hypothetical protein